jgi:hypothetical protein
MTRDKKKAVSDVVRVEFGFDVVTGAISLDVELEDGRKQQWRCGRRRFSEMYRRYHRYVDQLEAFSNDDHTHEGVSRQARTTRSMA